ncbi:MAG TPA: hypothetical protein VN131_02200 [Mobilitalea sp.]|nr:hypothetical protein [Mobilitalea sp.]
MRSVAVYTGRTSKQLAMPTLLTIGILVVIISFISITKVSLGAYHDKPEQPIVMDNSAFTYNEGLNTSEQDILTLLHSVINSPVPDEGNHNVSLYYNSLQLYLSSSKTNISPETAIQVKDTIIKLQDIIEIENKSDITKMSFDGRKIAIYLLERIYDLCNLNIVYNSAGDIERISNQTGKIIYNNGVPLTTMGYNLDALVITLVTIVILLGCCILIAKKNQLFSKDVIYDGFDEEGFA